MNIVGMLVFGVILIVFASYMIWMMINQNREDRKRRRRGL